MLGKLDWNASLLQNVLRSELSYSVASGPLLQLGLGALVEPPFDATLLELELKGRRLEVVRRVRELDEAFERRDPRLAPAEEIWRFAPGGGWRRG